MKFSERYGLRKWAVWARGQLQGYIWERHETEAELRAESFFPRAIHQSVKVYLAD